MSYCKLPTLFFIALSALVGCNDHHQHTKINLAINYFSQAPESILAKVNILGQQERLVADWLSQNLYEARETSEYQHSHFISLYSNQSQRQGTSTSALALVDVLLLKPESIAEHQFAIPKGKPILATTMNLAPFRHDGLNLFGIDGDKNRVFTKYYDKDLVGFISLNNSNFDPTTSVTKNDIVRLKETVHELEQNHINKIILVSQFDMKTTQAIIAKAQLTNIDVVLTQEAPKKAVLDGGTCYASFSNHFDQLDRLQLQFSQQGAITICSF
ncbi:TPA: hypothetical protein ACX6Q5_002469 [Photobacterium damselae]